MINNCWICEREEATTGEHVIMKAAFERIFGKLGNDKKVFISHTNGKKIEPIRSFRNDRLKFKKSICEKCNGALTKPYDNEFILFIEILLKTKSLVLSRNRLSFAGLNTKNLALYFIKIFGCLLKEVKGNIKESDYQMIRQSILQGEVLINNIHLSFHRDLGKLSVKRAKTVSFYPVIEKDFCAWIIDFDWISLIICYPSHPAQKKYGEQWNLNNKVTYLRLGKLKR